MAKPTDLRLLDLLISMARELVDRLGAEGCTVSRVIGDVLIIVAEYATAGQTLDLGQGYLVPDYPQTQDVLTTRRPHALTLDDADLDAAEAAVLRELGFASVLLLPFDLRGSTWGLVEVYRAEPLPFSADDMRAASEIRARTAARAG